MNNVSIQGNLAYINYKFDPFTVPVLAAFVPVIYVIPTVFAVSRIFKTYVGRLMKGKDDTINPHVFSIIVLSQISSFCYMLADYSTIRLPSTGIMTAWCASQNPNHGLKVLFMLSVYFNYTSMLFPFLLSILRLIPLYHHHVNHDQLCARIVRISTPVIFLYPLLFSFPLFPALGECRQLRGAYTFGSIYIFYDRSLFDLKQANTLFLNVIFWFLTSTVLNIVLYTKLRRLRKTRSLKLQKAEFSLSLTTISMLSAYISNLAFIAFFIFFPGSSAYLVALRPYGNDCDFVSVPWIFYLTHPIFKTSTSSLRPRPKRGTLVL